MTKEEVGKIAEASPDSVLIGDEKEREAYYLAIVAFDEKSGRFVYDYDRLVEAFAEDFKDSDDPYGAALEWVGYNVIRSLPYHGDRAPFVLYRDDDLDAVMDACAADFADERIARLYEEGVK